MTDQDFQNNGETQENASPTKVELQPAGFWLRVWAFCFDYSILAIPVLVIGYFFPGDFLGNVFGIRPDLPLDAGVVKSVFTNVTSVSWFLVIGFFYYPFFESSYLQATPGKLLFDLAVRDREGAPTSLLTAFIRHLAKATPVVPVLIGGMFAFMSRFVGMTSLSGTFLMLGFFFSFVLNVVQYPLAGITPDRRALHDLIAHTHVMRKRTLDLPEVAIKAILSVAICVCMSALSDSLKTGSDVSEHQITKIARDEVLNKIVQDSSKAGAMNSDFAKALVPTLKPVSTPLNYSRVNLAKVTIAPNSKHELSFGALRGYIIGFDPVGGADTLASKCQNGCIEILAGGKSLITSSGGIYTQPTMKRIEVAFRNLENFPVELIVYREIPVVSGSDQEN